MTYLNHAGTSWPKPDVVREAVADALRQSPTTWPATFIDDHRRVAHRLGIQHPSRLLLTPGGTSAISLAIEDLPWQSGDRILTSSLEHHALHRPAARLSSRGVEHTTIPRAVDGPLDVECLARELERGGVRLVAMTAACNVTGELLPVEEIASLARAHSALCLIDAAQTAGWLELPLRAAGVDIVAFAGHKGLQAPWGIGGLYVSLETPMQPLLASCALPAPGTRDSGVSCAPMPGYCDSGSVDRAALSGLCAALDWLEDSAQQDRLQRSRALVERVARVLERRDDARIYGVRDPEARLPTLAFTLNATSVDSIATRFAEREIVVSAGQQCAPLAHAALGTAPDGVLRLSAGPHTTADDISAAIEAIESL